VSNFDGVAGGGMFRKPEIRSCKMNQPLPLALRWPAVLFLGQTPKNILQPLKLKHENKNRPMFSFFDGWPINKSFPFFISGGLRG
jgi:hypothetical protein